MPRRRPRRNGGTGRRNLLAAVATGVAGIGIALNVLEPDAYTSAVLGRGANAAVADDPNAVLGMEGLSDPDADNVFTNNSTDTMNVTLDGTPLGDDGQFKWNVDEPVGDGDDDSPLTFSLAPGASSTVNVSGDADVEFDATAALVEDGSVVARIETTRTIGVPVVNNLKLNGSPSTSGNSGNFKFTLRNTGAVDVELRKIGIIETSTDADYVSGGGSFKNLDAGATLVSERFPIDNDTAGATLRSMSSWPVLDSRDDDDGTPREITFEFTKFRRDKGGGRGKGGGPSGGNSKNVGMSGADVKVELEVRNVEDDSIVSAPIDLCSGSCEF